MTLKKLQGSKQDTDEQVRGAIDGMMPITWKLWSYADLWDFVGSLPRYSVRHLNLACCAVERFRDVARQKPQYREFLDVFIDQYPIFENYRVSGEVLAG